MGSCSRTRNFERPRRRLAFSGGEPVELVRFYVDGAWHGQGLAHALMDDVLAVATARGAQTVWLSIWQVNARAVAFYRRRGFRILGEQTFHVGDDPQTDWVMARPVGENRGSRPDTGSAAWPQASDQVDAQRSL